MRKIFWGIGLTAMLLCAACGGRGSDGEDARPQTQEQDSDMIIEQTVPDTTIYGRADGFGQSGCTLITDDGRELELALTDEASQKSYATIYGQRNDTARYAVTLRDDGESVAVMINLSQLNRFVADYEIYNCHLILKDKQARDWVEITEFSDTLFCAKGRSGKEYKLRPR